MGGYLPCSCFKLLGRPQVSLGGRMLNFVVLLAMLDAGSLSGSKPQHLAEADPRQSREFGRGKRFRALAKSSRPRADHRALERPPQDLLLSTDCLESVMPARSVVGMAPGGSHLRRERAAHGSPSSAPRKYARAQACCNLLFRTQTELRRPFRRGDRTPAEARTAARFYRLPLAASQCLQRSVSRSRAESGRRKSAERSPSLTSSLMGGPEGPTGTRDVV